MLDHQNVGTSKCWNIKMLEHQNVGTSKCWNIKMLEHQNVGTSICWNIKMLVAYPEGVLGGLSTPSSSVLFLKLDIMCSILIIQKPVVVNYKNGVIKTMHYQLKLEICENKANHFSL